MSLFKNLLKIYDAGFRQTSDYDCGPASVVMVSRAFGEKRVVYDTLLTENYGRWLNRQAGRVRGTILTELHFAAEATLGAHFEVRLWRAFPENKKEFVACLKKAAASKLAVIINFNQDYIMGRKYENDDTAFTHYSPIAGYNGRKVIITDLDRKIDFPYAVNVNDVFQSMAEPHHIFGYPRGWLTIRQRTVGKRSR